MTLISEEICAACERSGAIGVVTSAKGSNVTLGLPLREAADTERATVGRFVAIRVGSANLVGAITELTAEICGGGGAEGFVARASLDLMGEISQDASGRRLFRRGVSAYPAIGDTAELISGRDLGLIYRSSARQAIEIGTIQQDPSIAASVNVDDLLSRHFAVLGTTGVGKSSGVTVILSEILRARPDLRIFLLDGHNEYGRCFGDKANIVGVRDLKLPFWLFNFEETVDVIYGGRPSVAEEIEILAELIPIAKSAYGQYKTATDRPTLKRGDPKNTGFTVDTPVPYLLQDLISLIDERMGRLENRSSRMNYHRLMARIETIRNDPRYAFMFENANVGGDVMGELVSHLFRLEPDGRPLTIMQLGGFPVEVVDAVVCVLCRLAFELGLWSEGAVPLLFVCEEAHRYASADPSTGFNPTRRALSRIAKEGRKYRVFLGLVTQRPAELDPTIISQCSTLFAMRMSNERDQALLRSAVSDAAANLLAFVPSLGTGEVIGFGEGVPLPTRMTFTQLPPDRVPQTEITGARVREDQGDDAAHSIDRVLARWRGATMSRKPQADDGSDRETMQSGSIRSRQSASIEQARERILKRPLDVADPRSSRLNEPAGGLGLRHQR